MLGLVTLMVLACGLNVIHAGRTLTPVVNPDCSFVSDCAHFGIDAPYSNTLVYIVSADKTDSNGKRYGIFWSTIGAPTFVIAEIPKNASEKVAINWLGFMQDREPELAFWTLWKTEYVGLVITKLIEFNDVNDVARFDPAANHTVHDLSTAQWYDAVINTTTNGDLLATLTGTYGDHTNNITLEVRAHTSETRADNPPRMLVQPSSMSLRVILNNQTTHWDHSRFALEMIYASNDSSNALATHSSEKAISDENSPGVFTVEKISGRDTFMEWKPIVYTKVSPGVSDSTRSVTGPLSNITSAFPNNSTENTVPYSLLEGLNGLLDPKTSVLRFNITLGISGDDFYVSSSYQEWNCEIGLGQPRLDGTSSNVSLIIGIGFGIPAVLILVGAIYVVYIRMKRRRQASQLIQETSASSYRTLD